MPRVIHLDLKPHIANCYKELITNYLIILNKNYIKLRKSIMFTKQRL